MSVHGQILMKLRIKDEEELTLGGTGCSGRQVYNRNLGYREQREERVMRVSFILSFIKERLNKRRYSK